MAQNVRKKDPVKPGVTREVIPDYVDPDTSDIGKGAGEAGTAKEDLGGGEPKRSDFPDGLGGTAAFNTARNAWREKQRAKSPQKQATSNLLKGMP